MHFGKIALAVAAAALAAASNASADETGLASTHDWVKVGGKTCFKDHEHTGHGDGLTKESARKAAIVAWADFTNLEYGTTWARFSLSHNAKTRYTKAEQGWSATVDATPCKK